MSGAAIERNSDGWFVTGEEWSGPWASKEAAELARDGEYWLAHQEHRRHVRVPLFGAERFA